MLFVVQCQLTLFAKVPLPAALAVAIALDTPAVVRTAGHFTLGHGDVTFGALPAVLAVANSATVVTVR
jgi:hypothetical protein